LQDLDAKLARQADLVREQAIVGERVDLPPQQVAGDRQQLRLRGEIARPDGERNPRRRWRSSTRRSDSAFSRKVRSSSAPRAMKS